MAKALQSVVVVLVGSPDATRKDVCLKKWNPSIGMGIKIFFSTSTSVKILSDRFLILFACLLSDSEAFRLSSEITSSLEHK
jgi:hypothetical protein